jgi:hypothetical protein
MKDEINDPPQQAKDETIELAAGGPRQDKRGDSRGQRQEHDHESQQKDECMDKAFCAEHGRDYKARATAKENRSTTCLRSH